MNTKAIAVETLEQVDPQAAEAYRRGELSDQDATNLVLSYAREKLADFDARLTALEAVLSEPERD